MEQDQNNVSAVMILFNSFFNLPLKVEFKGFGDGYGIGDKIKDFHKSFQVALFGDGDYISFDYDDEENDHLIFYLDRDDHNGSYVNLYLCDEQVSPEKFRVLVDDLRGHYNITGTNTIVLILR